MAVGDTIVSITKSKVPESGFGPVNPVCVFRTAGEVVVTGADTFTFATYGLFLYP